MPVRPTTINWGGSKCNYWIDEDDASLLPDIDSLAPFPISVAKRTLASGRSTKGISSVQDKSSISAAEVIKQLESDGNIDITLSPADNAARLLDNALKLDMPTQVILDALCYA